MSPYDELLLWASEKGGGSIASLRTACQWIAGRAGPGRWLDVLDDMVALGHVSVVAGRWNATPPLLTRLADGGGNALLVGARPLWLVEALGALEDSAHEPLRVLADFVYDNHVVAQKGPSSWYVAAGAGAPWGAFEYLGVRVFDDLAGALLPDSGSPAITVERSVRPGELVARLEDNPFDNEAASWIPVSTDQHPGAYVYLRNNQRVYALRNRQGWLEMDQRWAVWRAGGYKKVWFVPRARRLYVPKTVRLPMEVERALILRTGRLPHRGPALEVLGHGKQVLAFENITHELASRAARLVAAELEMR